MKKPRLFMYCDAVDSWIPFDANEIEGDLENLEDGEESEWRIRRKDMTDEEFNNLPEG